MVDVWILLKTPNVVSLEIISSPVALLWFNNDGGILRTNSTSSNSILLGHVTPWVYPLNGSLNLLTVFRIIALKRRKKKHQSQLTCYL